MCNRLLLAAAVGFGSLLLAGCSQTPCDRASKFDLKTKAGDCQLSTTGTVLGPKATCDSAMDACSDADRKVLDGVVGCFEALPVCSSADNLGWLAQSMGCYAPAQNLTEGCRRALFGDVIPGQDGGDAGVVDAGFPPDEADAGALDLFVTADETQIALAWTQSQPGAVSHWDLTSFTAADVREATVELPGSESFLTQDAGPGVKRLFYVLGLNAEGKVVYGEVDAGTPEPVDSGTAMCAGALDCPADMVCNLGTCQQLACQTPDVCPGGYLCGGTSHVCERQYGFNDGGTPDAGTPDAGHVVSASAPFVSELVEVSTGAPSWSSDRVTSAFAGKNPDVAAADTARQFVILDQESQVFGYWTEDRGRTWHSVPIDPIGQRPKVAYDPQSKTLFACYNAAGGIRVRRSLDFGKTWGTEAYDLANLSPDDGGLPPLISDCDIAVWQNGTAIVVGLEGDAIKMWAVTRDLNTVLGPDTIYDGAGTTYTNPTEVALATLPSESIIHVAFSGRRLVGGVMDTDVMGMYRGPGSTAFVGPKPLHNPNAYSQSAPAVAVDPVTKRGIAAFVSKEGPNSLETVYVSMWNPQLQQWASGTDLNVFALNKQSSAYVVMPDRVPGDDWVARSPSAAVTRNGRITIAYAAGKVVGSAPVLTQYSVGFDFEKFSELAINAKGWFTGPATQAPDATRVLRAGAREVAGPVLTADPQISTYSVFIEGVGANGDTANRPVTLSNPR